MKLVVSWGVCVCVGGGGGGGGGGGCVQHTVQRVVCSHELTRVDVFYNVSSVGVYDY